MSIIKMKKMVLTPIEAVDKVKQLKGVYGSKDYSDTVFFVADREKIITDYLNENNFQYQIKEIETSDKPTVLLKNNWFSKPFASLLTDGHLPHYGQIDPTSFYTICFCILFGVMFGDIGQGILLIIFGFLMRKKGHYSIFMRVGLFSTIFGWFYGSVFGNEEIIGELMQQAHLSYWRFGLLERANTETLLLAVAFIGILMILSAICINVIDKLLEKDYKGIIYSNNCLPAILFYICALIFGFMVLTKSQSRLLLYLALVILAISCVILLLDGTKEKRFGIISSSVIKYISAVMSFLQVGCFALAHAFLMYIVYYLASLASYIYPIIIIIGNLIVMAIEATEVWHQCNHIVVRTLHGFISDEEISLH
ncbi:MAG: V-type ATPase 116kDa subunit family protein [Erysipelotrichaceae bacterium]